MAVGDIWRFEYVTRWSFSQNQVMVGHFEVTAITGLGLTKQEIADAESNRAAGIIPPLIPTLSRYDGLRARLYPLVANQYVISVAGAIAGAMAGELASPQLSVVVTKRAITGPPRTRGRCYWPSPTENEENANGRVDEVYRTSVQGAATQLFMGQHTLGVGADTVTMKGVVRRESSGNTYTISSMVARQAFGTQRRRAAINRGDAALN